MAGKPPFDPYKDDVTAEMAAANKANQQKVYTNFQDSVAKGTASPVVTKDDVSAGTKGAAKQIFGGVANGDLGAGAATPPRSEVGPIEPGKASTSWDRYQRQNPDSFPTPK